MGLQAIEDVAGVAAEMQEGEHARVRKLVDREASLAAREGELAQRERHLMIREQQLQLKEQELADREQTFARSRQCVRAVCSHCRQGTCSRKGPCYNDFGLDGHHHSCSACHNLWRQGKGAAKGRLD